MNKIKKYLSSLFEILRLPEILILPGNVSYYLILSIIPIISLIGIIASSINLSTTGIVNYLESILPGDIVEFLISSVNKSGFGTTSVIFFIVGFYVASNGPESLITASSILYKKENPNYIYRRVKALIMTFFIILLFIFILIVLAFGSVILTKILNFGELGKFITKHYIIITILKFLLAFIFLYMTIKIIYTMSITNIKSKYVNKGTLFATISIILVTSVYSFYVNNLAHYDVIYGSLSTIAILMLLIHFICYILVVGMAINSKYYNSLNNK